MPTAITGEPEKTTRQYREALESVWRELNERFGHADAPYTPWALQMMAEVGAVLEAGDQAGREQAAVAEPVEPEWLRHQCPGRRPWHHCDASDCGVNEQGEGCQFAPARP